MSKLVDIETIRNEIERKLEIVKKQQEENTRFGGFTLFGKSVAYNEMLSFLDALPEEKHVNINKELENLLESNGMYIDDDWKVRRNDGDSTNNRWQYELVARYFYSIGQGEHKTEEERSVELEKEIESLEQEHVPKNEEAGTCEPKGKTNHIFEECVAKVDPATMKEVSDNVDKMLDAPKIRGWVARDKNGALYLHNDKPFQTKTLWTSATYIALYADMFPEHSFEDEPIEVELTLKPIKNE